MTFWDHGEKKKISKKKIHGGSGSFLVRYLGHIPGFNKHGVFVFSLFAWFSFVFISFSGVSIFHTMPWCFVSLYLVVSFLFLSSFWRANMRRSNLWCWCSWWQCTLALPVHSKRKTWEKKKKKKGTRIYFVTSMNWKSKWITTLPLMTSVSVILYS